MPSADSSPEVVDELLEVVVPGFATDPTLARGTDLNMKIEMEQKRNDTKVLPGYWACRLHRCGDPRGSCRPAGPS